MNEWICVKDKAPEDLKSVLFTDGKEVFLGYQIPLLDGFFIRSTYAGSNISDVTHWMPLPNPPEIN